MNFKRVERKDFEDEKGRVNWSAYSKAQRNNGESCYECGAFIFRFSSRLDLPGFRTLCGSCNSLATVSDEVYHTEKLRCPKCGATRNVYDMDGHGLYEEGTHYVAC